MSNEDCSSCCILVLDYYICCVALRACGIVAEVFTATICEFYLLGIRLVDHEFARINVLYIYECFYGLLKKKKANTIMQNSLVS